jgi:hypothetical protein
MPDPEVTAATMAAQQECRMAAQKIALQSTTKIKKRMRRGKEKKQADKKTSQSTTVPIPCVYFHNPLAPSRSTGQDRGPNEAKKAGVAAMAEVHVEATLAVETEATATVKAAPKEVEADSERLAEKAAPPTPKVIETKSKLWDL